MPEIGTSKITAERIRFLFAYDLSTGDLTRLIYQQPNGLVGNIIKGDDLRVDGERHSISRYVWLHHYGEWPPIDKWIDHINHDRNDNRIENLRLASIRENSYNRRSMRNQFGYKGIEFRARKKPWTVRLYNQGKRIYVGAYSTLEEAEEASKQAAIELHGEFACLE